MRNLYMLSAALCGKMNLLSSLPMRLGTRSPKHPILSVLLLLFCSFTQAQVTPVNGTTTFNTINPVWTYVEYGRSANATTGFTAVNVASSGWDISGYSSGAGPFVIAGENWGSGSDGGFVYVGSEDGAAYLTSMRFKANDGKLFDLNTIDLGYDIDYGKPATSAALTITGFRNGSPVSGASFAVPVFAPFGKGGTWSRGINIASNSNFQGIDEFRITPNTADILSILDVDNINATNFRTAGVLLSSSPTLTFTNASGFADNSAQDGEGGSTVISDFNIQVMPIDNAGNKLTADPLQYHDGTDWPDYPSIITYGNMNAHYGWSIRSDNGVNFSLVSLSFLDWGDFGANTYVAEAFSNGSSLGTIMFTGNNSFTMVELTNTGLLTSIFSNVDEVRIYRQGGADAWIALNNVRVSAPTAVMPLTWLSFTGSKKGQTVELKWSTATEQNTKEFVVQHSTDGRNWTGIGTKAAAGNSTAVQQYAFVHQTPAAGTNYYRLLQRDLDGKWGYSKIVTADLSGREKGTEIYPNPVTGGVLQVKLSKETIVQVFNSAGHLVHQQKLGAGTHVLPVNHLPAGVYTIKTATESTRFVIP